MNVQFIMDYQVKAAGGRHYSSGEVVNLGASSADHFIRRGVAVACSVTVENVELGQPVETPESDSNEKIIIPETDESGFTENEPEETELLVATKLAIEQGLTTAAGKPTVTGLEEITGRDVTADERDKAWEQYQAEVETNN